MLSKKLCKFSNNALAKPRNELFCVADERNVSLAKNITDFVSHTVISANSELNTVDQQLLKCQVKVQEAADILKMLVSDINKMEYKLESLLSTNYIPDINVTENPSTWKNIVTHLLNTDIFITVRFFEAT